MRSGTATPSPRGLTVVSHPRGTLFCIAGAAWVTAAGSAALPVAGLDRTVAVFLALSILYGACKYGTP
jgi:hypothetical protein